MIDDAARRGGDSSMPLEGVALGVDHLEALVVFLLAASETHSRWVRTGASLSAEDVATVAREAYLAAATASARIDPAAHERREAAQKPSYPTVTIDDPSHLVVVHRVRAFGIAMVFERDAPLGLARAFAQKIVTTLEHELPYTAEPRPVVLSTPPVVVPVASVRGPSVFPSPAPMPAASGRPSPPPPSPHGSTEARTLVSQVSPVLPAPPARVTVPPMVAPAPQVPEARPTEPGARDPIAPAPPPRIASAPPPEPDAGPDTGRTPPPERGANERYGNGPDTIARPRPAPTAEEIAAVRKDEAPSSTGGRARRLVALLEERSVEPHLVRTRLGLRTGLGLDALLDPRSLSTEAIVLLETAAEDMLGVDHEGLVSLLKAGADGGAS